MEKSKIAFLKKYTLIFTVIEVLFLCAYFVSLVISGFDLFTLIVYINFAFFISQVYILNLIRFFYALLYEAIVYVDADFAEKYSKIEHRLKFNNKFMNVDMKNPAYLGEVSMIMKFFGEIFFKRSDKILNYECNILKNLIISLWLIFVLQLILQFSVFLGLGLSIKN